MSYTPQPIPTDHIKLSKEILDLTERLAENNHDIWAQGRLREGWTYGPTRNDPKKEHPDLIPYQELPDSEKEFDRLAAMQTLKAIIALGYQIKPG